MASNDLVDINSNLKCSLLTDTLNENNKALKTIAVPNRYVTMNSYTDSATTRYFVNIDQNVAFGALSNYLSNYYDKVQVWGSAASSGVGNITIYGIDFGYNETSEIISLGVNNSTPVLSINSYRFINRMTTVNRGANTGIKVYCSTNAGSALTTFCSQTYYQNINPFFMVPKGYKARLVSIDNYGGTAVTTVSLLVQKKQSTANPNPALYLPNLPSGASRIYNDGGGVGGYMGDFVEGQTIFWGQVSTASTLSSLQWTLILYPETNYV